MQKTSNDMIHEAWHELTCGLILQVLASTVSAKQLATFISWAGSAMVIMSSITFLQSVLVRREEARELVRQRKQVKKLLKELKEDLDDWQTKLEKRDADEEDENE